MWFKEAQRRSFIKEYIDKTRWRMPAEAYKDFNIQLVCTDAEYAWFILSK